MKVDAGLKLQISASLFKQLVGWAKGALSAVPTTTHDALDGGHASLLPTLRAKSDSLFNQRRLQTQLRDLAA